MMNNQEINGFVDKPSFANRDRAESRKVLSLFSTRSIFEDLKWYFDIVQKPGTKATRYTTYFNKCPLIYREILKYYTLSLLSDKSYDAVTVCSYTKQTNVFLRYLANVYPLHPLKNVNRAIISEYVAFLNKKYAYETRIKNYRGAAMLFEVMREFDEMPGMSPLLPENPFPRLRKAPNPKKMILPYVTSQMDLAFKKEDVPLHLRAAYWIMRSFPSRVSEITGMPIESILPALRSGFFTLKIPTWKQNGGYLQSESRLMEIKNEGHGAFLLDLIKQQQQFALKSQNSVNECDKNLLMLYEVEYVHKTKGVVKRKRKVGLNQSLVLNGFNKVCIENKIMDENGKLYLFTSHQLRHCGITDRIYAGFRLEDVRDMTNHKDYRMLVETYIHIDNKELKKKQEAQFDDKGYVSNKEVLFKGVIMITKNQEIRILSNPKAVRIGKIGICADAMDCNNGPTECLKCNYFIPDAEELDYFEEQIHVWEKKLEMFSRNPIWREHAMNNVIGYQNVVDRINAIM